MQLWILSNLGGLIALSANFWLGGFSRIRKSEGLAKGVGKVAGGDVLNRIHAPAYCRGDEGD